MKSKGDMDFRYFNLFLLVEMYVFAFHHKSASAVPLQICVADSMQHAKKTMEICQSIGKISKYRVECFMEKDRLNCLRRLTTGDADATVLYPENLLAAAAYSEYNILVTNELRLFEDEAQEFEMVVVAHKDVKGLSDLRGRGYCHPGHEPTDEWSTVFLEYFENWIIFRECNFDKTLLENRIAGLSKYFKAACVAGPWSAEPAVDGKLKSTYRNLCALCDNPTGCHAGDKYHGREGALLCLTDNIGDVAWVRLDDTLEHFKVAILPVKMSIHWNISRENIDKADFNYICPDGTIRQVGVGEPCVWITRPWPVMVSRREVAERVASLVSSIKTAQYAWQRNLSLLLENYKVTPVSLDNVDTPEDFLRRFPGFLSANNRTPCRPSRTVRWCVSSDIEDQKCQWIRQAAYSYGVEPSISCIREPTRELCLEAVGNERATLFVAKSDELLDARKKGLTSIVHATTKKQRSIDGIVALVRDESSFEKLADLKDAKACFTAYRSVGWNSFHSVMRNLSEGNWDCSDMKGISQFFKEACVADLAEKSRRATLPHQPPSNLYSLCKDGSSNADDLNTFRCLESGTADVVFVNLKTLQSKTGGHVQDRRFTLNDKTYRTLCTHESLNYNERTCLLTWTALATVVVHENITDLRREEIYSLLLELDHLFGRSFHGRAPTLSLYDEFDNKSNIIFPEKTQHLQSPDGGFQMPGVRSYDEIVEDLATKERFKCVASKAAGQLNIHSTVIFNLCIFSSVVQLSLMFVL